MFLGKTREHISVYVSGEAVCWGIYGVGFAEYDIQNNAAVCTYRLYNQCKT